MFRFVYQFHQWRHKQFLWLVNLDQKVHLRDKGQVFHDDRTCHWGHKSIVWYFSWTKFAPYCWGLWWMWQGSWCYVMVRKSPWWGLSWGLWNQLNSRRRMRCICKGHTRICYLEFWDRQFEFLTSLRSGVIAPLCPLFQYNVTTGLCREYMWATMFSMQIFALKERDPWSVCELCLSSHPNAFLSHHLHAPVTKLSF